MEHAVQCRNILLYIFLPIVNILHHLLLFTGEQEVRVLTLAEQIIAAMPERIKVSGLHF